MNQPFTLERSALCSAVSAVMPGWRKSGTVDYHQTLLLDCAAGKLTLATASGLGHVWTVIDVDSDATFRIAVPAQSMGEFCSLCRSESLKVSLSGNKLCLDGNRGELKLAFHETQPENIKGWPSLPPTTSTHSFKLPVSELLFSLRAALVATDECSAKYDLGSVHVEIDGAVIHFWSTDGKMIAIAKGPCEREGDDKRAMSIPEDTAKAICAALRSASAADTVTLSESPGGNCVIVQFGATTLVMALSAGKRPKDFLSAANRYVNEAKSLVATVSKSELASAVRAALIGTDALDDLGAAVLLVSDGDDVRVLSNARSDNQIDMPLAAKDVEGKAAMLVNKAFLMALATACGQDEFTLEIADFAMGDSRGQRAVISTSDGRFFGVAMGMALENENLKRAQTAMVDSLLATA